MEKDKPSKRTHTHKNTSQIIKLHVFLSIQNKE